MNMTPTEKKLTIYARRNVSRAAMGISQGYDNNPVVAVKEADGFGRVAYRPLAGDCYGHPLGTSGAEAMRTLRRLAAD